MCVLSIKVPIRKKVLSYAPCITNPDQSRPRSIVNEMVTHILQSFRIGASQSNCLVLCPRHALCRVLTPHRRCSWCILQSTGLQKMEIKMEEKNDNRRVRTMVLYCHLLSLVSGGGGVTHKFIALVTAIRDFPVKTLLTKSYKSHARDVMVIVVGNGHGDTSSNLGRDWLHFA